MFCLSSGAKSWKTLGTRNKIQPKSSSWSTSKRISKTEWLAKLSSISYQPAPSSPGLVLISCRTKGSASLLINSITWGSSLISDPYIEAPTSQKWKPPPSENSSPKVGDTSVLFTLPTADLVDCSITSQSAAVLSLETPTILLFTPISSSCATIMAWSLFRATTIWLIRTVTPCSSMEDTQDTSNKRSLKIWWLLCGTTRSRASWFLRRLKWPGWRKGTSRILSTRWSTSLLLQLVFWGQSAISLSIQCSGSLPLSRYQRISTCLKVSTSR